MVRKREDTYWIVLECIDGQNKVIKKEEFEHNDFERVVLIIPDYLRRYKMEVGNNYVSFKIEILKGSGIA